jgi:two-component system LytT family response regulator
VRTGAPSIACFGRFEAGRSGGNDPIRFPTVKTEELLAFFLVHRDTTVSKWAICESLWPGLEPERVEQNLHTTVYRMKKTLTDNGIPIFLSSRRGVYRFQYDGECDYIRFELALKGRGESSRETERALRQYAGPLFGDKDYLWCSAERERMHALFVRKSMELAEAYMKEGAFGKAIPVLQHTIARTPLEEAVYELLLRAYYELGDRASFLLHYNKLEQHLNEELQLKPGEQISRLRRMISERN